MLRYKTEARPGLVTLYTTSGQETERVYSHNPEPARGVSQEQVCYAESRARIHSARLVIGISLASATVTQALVESCDQ